MAHVNKNPPKNSAVIAVRVPLWVYDAIHDFAEEEFRSDAKVAAAILACVVGQKSIERMFNDGVYFIREQRKGSEAAKVLGLLGPPESAKSAQSAVALGDGEEGGKGEKGMKGGKALPAPDDLAEEAATGERRRRKGKAG